MDIFDFGMQMEKDGEAYYRELAGKCGDKGLTTIMTLLADSEVKHYKVLKEMKEKTDSNLVQTTVLKDVINVFARMKEEAKTFDFNVSQIDLYRKAQDLEKKSEVFYREKSDQVEAEVQKEIFRKLAEEEKEHFMILENICDFVSRPGSWLENAEWHQMEEY